MRIDEFNWDNLIILDAARHDLYEEVNGQTRKRRTVGSSSEDFIEKTFDKQITEDNLFDWDEVVLITANPHYHPDLFEEATGQKPSELFKDCYMLFSNDKYWNEETGTVLPASVQRAVLSEAVEEHGHETKYLIHMMQPHTPFVGGWGDPEVQQDQERELNVWDRLEKGEFTDQQVWTAYKDNLEYVMTNAEIIDDFLLGQTVITADHGNAFGENNEYGHPSGSKNPVLRHVPLDYL